MTTTKGNKELTDEQEEIKREELIRELSKLLSNSDIAMKDFMEQYEDAADEETFSVAGQIEELDTDVIEDHIEDYTNYGGISYEIE